VNGTELAKERAIIFLLTPAGIVSGWVGRSPL